MNITKVEGIVSERYSSLCRYDLYPYATATYRIDRGLAFGAHGEPPERDIDFNPFEYLHSLIGQTESAQIEVLEGGCGEGRALRQLKQGAWRNYPVRRAYEGLGDNIRTTGVTLSLEHALVAERYGIDEVFVGP